MAEIEVSNDWNKLGTVIGSAFAEDPVTGWISSNPKNPVLMFRQLARHVYVPGGKCYLAGDLGGALWLENPRAMGLPLLPTISLGVEMIMASGVQSVWRALAVENAMLRRHPRVPHMYLFAVGVSPQARGRGVGRSLMTHVLADCDARGMAAYLENSNPRNASLYMGLGFKPGDPFTPAQGAPQLTPMWREPVAP